MKYKLHLLLLLLYPALLLAQSTMTPKEFTAAKLKLAKTKDDAIEAELLYKIALYHLEKDRGLNADIDSAVQLNKQLIALNKRTGRKANIAQSMLLDSKIAKVSGLDSVANDLKRKALQYATNNKLFKEEGDIYYSMGEDVIYKEEQKTYEFYSKAASQYHKSGALFNESETVLALALVDMYYDRFDRAVGRLNKSITIKKSIKRSPYKEYITLAGLYGARGKYKEALEYALNAEKITENQDIPDIWRITIYNYLGGIYIYLGTLDKATDYHLKALPLVKKTKETGHIMLTVMNISNILYRQKKYAESLAFLDKEVHYRPGKECNLLLSSVYLENYLQLKQYEKAKPYYENLLKFKDDKYTESHDLELMYHAMTHYLLKTGQAQKSYAYIDKLSALGKKKGNSLDISKVEQARYKADSATGNFASAFEHLKLYKALKDSIFNISSTGQLHDLQLKYETEKKDRNIKLLNSQNQLQRTRADSAEKTRNITLGGIVFSLVIIGLLFSLYRIKQRSNLKLEEHQLELDQKNAFLEKLTADQDKLLKEKEWLVKEVHHRVKNNLQMVTSLLYSQSVYLEDDAAKRAVKDSLHRMQAMALIHQKLYQDENTSTVSMQEYFGELLMYLRESFDAADRITFNQSVEPVQLDVSQAIPLGLIVTESIVNAIKYAFLNEQRGTVNVNLHHDGDKHLLLEISDDGVGLPSDPDEMERNSLGLDLMKGLAKQLKGTFSIVSEHGVHISVRFEKNK